MNDTTQIKLNKIYKNCYQQLKRPEMAYIREYLKNRGIDEYLVDEFKLGYGKFYGTYWITIPILCVNRENCLLLKLRKDPRDEKNKIKYIFYPRGMGAQIYGLETLKANTQICLCEGEMDRIVAISQGIPAITSTAGASGFKKEFLPYFGKDIETIHVCFDSDKAGKENAQKVAELLKEEAHIPFVYIITLPKEGQDLTDYFIKDKGDIDDLFSKYSKLAKSTSYETKWEQVYNYAMDKKGGISEKDIEIARNIDCSKLVKVEKRVGEVDFGLCPFHNEKTPSFAMYAGERGFFCYGCKSSGNAITLTMKLKDLRFPEAVKYLLNYV